MIRAVRVFILAAAAAAAACDEGVTGPTVPVNQSFELAPGGAAAVAGASMTVRFERVSGDSRCPGDAICVWAGDAVVQIAVLSGGAVAPYELHTFTREPVKHGDMTIQLVDLQPYPFSSRPIAPGDYRATLRVTR